MSECLHCHEETVQAGNECPHCREVRMDKLIWDEDGVIVLCQTCGNEYDPLEVANRE